MKSRWSRAALGMMLAIPAHAQDRCPWQASWGASQYGPDPAPEQPQGALTGKTLRQVVRVSIGGDHLRVRLSNAFGRTPLTIGAASVALSADNSSSRIVAASARPLRFAGRADVTIPPGGEWISDAIALRTGAFADLAVTLHVVQEGQGQTSHPGSRATSYVVPGERTLAADLDGAARIDRWYLLAGVEAQHCGKPGIVVLGDSITDGFGVKPNTNARWTDFLARRLGGRVAVINQGIGGNRVRLDGLGPNAVARFDRDILSHPGLGHVVFLIGINDIGTLTRERPASAQEHRALVEQVTGAYAQLVARARAQGLKAHGATILPFMGSGYYHPDALNEADRQAINAWIRTPGNFDGVIDFDAAMRDPERPAYLLPAYDSGDGLHPSIAGYRAMAELVPLRLFR